MRWIILILLVMWLAALLGCQTAQAFKPAPSTAIPAATTKLTENVTGIKSSTHAINTDAKGIIAASEAVGNPPAILDPANDILAQASLIDVSAAALMTIQNDLKTATAENAKLVDAAKKAMDERDVAVAAKNQAEADAKKAREEASKSLLVRYGVACFAIAVLAIVSAFVGPMFLPVWPMKISVGVAIAAFIGGACFTFLAAHLTQIIWIGGIILLTAVVVLIVAWKKGWLVNGQLEGAVKLTVEAMSDQTVAANTKMREAVAALRTALPAFNALYNKMNV